MAQVIADRRDIDFNLYEMFELEALCNTDLFSEFNKKTFDLILNEARSFSVKELLPTYEDGDKIGVHFENGVVKVPESFHRGHKLYLENEWAAPSAAQEFGGQGLPYMLGGAIKEYMMGGNWPLYSYGSMGVGTGRMIEHYGTEEQKNLYLEKLYTGEWGGTMLLTEPEAGTDVGSLTTSAIKNDDGTYSLTGNKIFITNGEHDLTPNIIHPVLARIEGDPPGTKGISIFIVPKYLVNPDGSLGERNDIECTGTEEKHGIHGSATCSMSMGSKGRCVGFLLGEEKKGMKIMFNMMNGARLSTGVQSLAYSSTTYLYALNYARTRIQGRALKDMADHAAPSVPIIQHPDVRRNLIWMKSYVEGLRSLVYYTGKCMDQMNCAEGDAEKKKMDDLIGLLTPIIKGYGSERGYEVCVQAMQVYGGAGYTQDYPVEALTRDCKIASIYEGCTGIQAMDLVGRKLKVIFSHFFPEVESTLSKAAENEALTPLVNGVEKAFNRFKEITGLMGKMLAEGKYDACFLQATPYMEVMGDICMAWMHLWRAAIASEKLTNAKKKDLIFYDGQLKTAEFFILSMLPVTIGKIDAIGTASCAAIEMSESGFGGM